ncbi:ribosome maturation factor RimP [Helicobacter sp. 13S00477-4]|uniref:ribosome maturation factor RimP n=1 Tax=Helicobacter sp. 13S00477-4 TaxID=1905759 RepID=UPI000BD2077C|nr:ribosome maturation factor RimP [Helicobacter sp. 13S00477-4]PAF51661.1 hypothetical protein BKH44_05095 [Helicobacter sp. 13S00477-4]
MIPEELEEKLDKLIDSVGCYLYDIAFLKENNTDILRISILAKNGNTTLDKCEEVSQLISPVLDVYDPINIQYTLEVSSPGIERLLKTSKHFELSLNEEVLVKTDENEIFEAFIRKVDAKGVFFEFNKEERFYPFERLKKVKTILRW